MSSRRDGDIVGHYAIGGLKDRILDGLKGTGVDLGALRPVDLAPVDEFHMGGRAATADLIKLMRLQQNALVLDIGSGLGGVARYLASECKCHTKGIDLTPEYVEVADMLTDLTGLADRVEFKLGSALDLPWHAEHFDAAVTFHASMNIRDRPRLYAEVARVLRPGASFGSYDVLKGPREGMIFPVPWAQTSKESYLVSPSEMVSLLDNAGFDVIHQEDRRNTALEHHRARLKTATAGRVLPPLGLHLLQREDGPQASRNMMTMLEAEQITLQMVIARRR
jgi:MPBQ/MSBQ methyltransferase